MKLAITKKRNLWWAISGTAMIASIIIMVVSYFTINAPIRPGLDFVGGTRIQIAKNCSVASNCEQPIDTNQVRGVLDTQGLGNSTIQLLGEDKQILSIRTQNLDGNQRSTLLNSLSETIGQFDPKTQ
jgi:preprotein translocase subunit SecF